MKVIIKKTLPTGEEITHRGHNFHMGWIGAMNADRTQMVVYLPKTNAYFTADVNPYEGHSESVIVELEKRYKANQELERLFKNAGNNIIE